MPSVRLSNHEMVTLAVYQLGGDLHAIDTEDIAVKANELAPGRFTWRKYQEQINIETVRKRLWDATRPDKGAYLRGTERQGWRLTEAGLDFARRFTADIPPARGGRRLSRQEQHWLATERGRLLTSPALAAFQRAGPEAVSRQDAEAFFRVDDYVTGAAREAKIDRLLNAFVDDADLGPAIRQLAAVVRGG
jgi:hypothetical protein